MAELLPENAPEQAAPEQAGPPDYAVKRMKFLTKFTELDPDAKLDDASLGEILADEAKRDEFAQYVGKLNPKFGMSGEQLADALGYAKKKAQLEPSGDTAAISSLAPSGDESAVAPPPGAEAMPAASSGPQIVDSTQIGAQLAADPEQRARIISDEAQTIGLAEPGTKRTIYTGPVDEQGIPISKDGIAPYRARNSDTGVYYTDEPLSKMVDGKEQSEDDAGMLTIRNQFVEGVKGFSDFAGALNRKVQGAVGIDPAIAEATSPFHRISALLGKGISEVSPFHEASQSLHMKTARVAGLALPALLTMFVPEGKLAQVASTVVGMNFDGQMLAGSKKRGEAAGLSGSQLDNYTLADGAATLLVFKLGGAGLNAVGQKLAKTAVMEELGATLKAAKGRISEAEMGGLYAKAMPEVLARLQAAAKGGAHLGPLMAANTIKEKIGEHIANQQLGRAVFAEHTLGQNISDVVGSGIEGTVIGGISKAVEPMRGTKAVETEGPRLFPKAKEAEYDGKWIRLPTNKEVNSRPIIIDVTTDGKYYEVHDGKNLHANKPAQKWAAENIPRLLSEHKAGYDAAPAREVADETKEGLANGKEHYKLGAEDGDAVYAPATPERLRESLDSLMEKAKAGTISLADYRKTYFYQRHFGNHEAAIEALGRNPVRFVQDLRAGLSEQLGEQPVPETPEAVVPQSVAEAPIAEPVAPQQAGEPEVAQEAPEQVQPEQPPADPSVVDVTGQAPEPIPAEGEPSATNATEIPPVVAPEQQAEPVQESAPFTNNEQSAQNEQPPVDSPPLNGAGQEIPDLKDRKSMVSADNSPAIAEPVKAIIKESGLDKYESRSQADAVKVVDAELATLSTPDMVAKAIRGDVKHNDVRTALRIKTLERLSTEIDAAEANGDAETVAALSKDAYAVAKAHAETLTAAGQEISIARLMNRHSPAAVVHNAEVEMEKQAEAVVDKIKKKKLPKESKDIARAKKEAVENAVATPKVQAVRDTVAGKAKRTTKEELATEKASRAQHFADLKRLESSMGVTPQQQAIAELHVKIFKSYIKSGMLKVRELVEQFKKDNGGLPRGTTQEELAKRAAAALGDHQEGVRQGVADLGTTLDKIARDYLTDAASTGKTLAERFVDGTGLDPVAAKQYADAIEAEFTKRIAAARQKRIDELNKRAAATPTKRASPTDLQKTQELFTLSPTDDNAILDHLKRTTDIPTLTAADAANLRALAKKVTAAKGERAKADAVFDLMLAQKNLKGVTAYESVKAFFFAHLLSGPFTHMKNVISTGVNGGIQLFHETGYAGYLGMLQSVRTKSLSGASLITAPFRGIAATHWQAMDAGYRMLSTGVDQPNQHDKYGVPNDLEALRRRNPTASNLDLRAMQLGLQKYAATMSYVSRALKANDVYWQVQFAGMRAMNLAVSKAMETNVGAPTADIWRTANELLYNTSLRLADAHAQAQSEIPGAGKSRNPMALDNVRFRMRVQELMEETRDAEIAKESKEGAARDAFNGPLEGVLGDVISKITGLTEVEGPGGVQFIKTQIPFTSIVANMVNASLNYNPIIGGYRALRGKIGVNGNAFQREYSPKERFEVGTKAAIGAGITYMAMQGLLGHNRLSGNGPDDPEKKKALQATGWQDHSLNMGTEDNPIWWRYSDSSFNSILSSVSGVSEGEAYNGADYSKDPLSIKRLNAMAFGAIQGIMSTTALQKVDDILNAIGGSGRGSAADRFSRFIQRAAGTSSGTLLTPFGNFTTQVSKVAQSAAGGSRRDAKSITEVATQYVNPNGTPLMYDDLGYPMRLDNDVFLSTAPEWHDDNEHQIRAFQAKYGTQIPAAFVPKAERMDNDMQVLQQGGSAGPLTDSERQSMQTMTDQQRVRFLKGRGDGESPMGEAMFAAFRQSRALKIREALIMQLPEIQKMADDNPRVASNMLTNIYSRAKKQAKLEVLSGDASRLSLADQQAIADE